MPVHRRRLTVPQPALSAALLCLLAAAPAAAQVRVTTLAKADRAIQDTQEIRLERFADLTEVRHLQVGDVLADGDQLTALAPDLFVELTCPRGTLLRLSGPFRSVVTLPGDTDCGLDQLSGGLDVLTDQPTEIRTGGKTLGTPGTRYAVRLSRDDSGPNCRLLVFEGHVEVKGAGPLRQISTAQSLTFSRQAANPEPQPVTPEEIQRWAGLYARFDIAKAETAGVTLTAEQRTATEAQLTRLHAAVLSDPAASQTRLALADAQIKNKVGDEGLYNLRRTQMVDPGKLRQIQPEKLQHKDSQEYRRLDKILREIPAERVSPPPSGSERRREPR
jgi:hypothetical protein